MLRRVAAVSAFCFIILTGCEKDYGPVSRTMVQPTSDFPAVVSIRGIRSCTGTIVSPRAILTAAHCIQGDAQFQAVTRDGLITAQRTYSMGNVDSPEDIAIMVLPRALTTRPYSIGNVVVEDEWVTLVGYGCTNMETRYGAGVKRTGKNVIRQIGEYIEVETPVRFANLLGPSNRAGSCFGDSGGPLLRRAPHRETVVGVLHAVVLGDRQHTTRFVNLTAPPQRQFLERINAQERLGIQFDNN